MKEVSLGTVVNVLADDPVQWRNEVDRVRQLPGLGHVEIWLEHMLDRQQVTNLRGLLDGLEVTVHGPFVDMNLSTSWPELADLAFAKTRRAVEIADALGAGAVTLHAGKYAAYEEHTASLSRFAERVRRLSKNADATIAVENVKDKHSGVSRETVARRGDVEKLVELYPETRLTIDVAHALQNRDDPASMIEAFADRIATVHVHDTIGDGPSHRALGEGAVDFATVTQAILRTQPRYVTLETLGAAETRRSWHTLHKWLGRSGVSTMVA